MPTSTCEASLVTTSFHPTPKHRSFVVFTDSIVASCSATSVVQTGLRGRVFQLFFCSFCVNSSKINMYWYVHTYILVCTYIHTGMYIHTYWYVHTYILVCTYIHTGMYIHTYWYVHTYILVCTYIHTGMYIHTYILVCTYIRSSSV